MDKSPITPQTPQSVTLENAALKNIFLEHLNNIYLGKHHLINFLKEIKEIAALTQLKLAIDECNGDTESQIKQMDEIFESIHEKPTHISILGMKAITLEAYMTTIKAGKTPAERDVFIIFYLQLIEGIEITYFKVLKNLAKSIGYNHTFVDQPFDLAVENKILFELIHQEYIS